MEILLSDLNKYNPKNKTKKKKEETLDNAHQLFFGRQGIISGFENGVFRLPKFQDENEKQPDKKLHKKEQAKLGLKEFNDYDRIKKWVKTEIFKEYFSFLAPSFMLRDLICTNVKEKNDKLVGVIRSGLKVSEEEIDEMTDYQKAIEKPDVIVNIVEEILKFNEKYEKQRGKGLKILTP